MGGGSVAGPKTPWSAFLSEATLTFGPDGDFVVSDERTGFLPVIDPADVTYDQQHLAFASLKAEIPWDEGGTSTVDFTLEAISDRFLYGNDGPALDDFGLVRKFVDKCSTQVNQAHQKSRIASMSGLFDGAPVHTYTSFPSGAISYNHFVSIDVTPGWCD